MVMFCKHCIIAQSLSVHKTESVSMTGHAHNCLDGYFVIIMQHLCRVVLAMRKMSVRPSNVWIVKKRKETYCEIFIPI